MGRLALLALLGISASGCGTALNVRSDGQQKVYGAVQHDLECIRHNLDTSKPRKLPVLSVAIGLLDLPFSLIGDTLTLPLTISATVRKREPPHKEAAPHRVGDIRVSGNGEVIRPEHSKPIPSD